MRQVAFPECDILACWQTLDLDEGTVVGIYASLLSLIQSASIACDYTKAWIPATVQVWRACLRYFELFEASTRVHLRDLRCWSSQRYTGGIADVGGHAAFAQ